MILLPILEIGLMECHERSKEVAHSFAKDVAIESCTATELNCPHCRAMILSVKRRQQQKLTFRCRAVFAVC